MATIDLESHFLAATEAAAIAAAAWRGKGDGKAADGCLLYTSPSPRDKRQSRMPSSA